MENPQHSDPYLAAVSTVISMVSAFFALISIKDAQAIAGLVASAVAIVSGVFAIRYYYHSTKKLKQK